MCAVYVDDVRAYPISMIQPSARRFGTLWSHMSADTDEELHAMADKLGLRRSYAQHMDSPQQWRHHYDLIPSKRHQAIRLGALQVDVDPNLERWIRKKRNVA
jgi:uncharacterized protein DUF4031